MHHSQRKKVLYIITKSVWGGAGRYVFDLATNLPPDQFEIAVALGHDQNKQTSSLAIQLKEKNIPVYIVQHFQKSINPIQDIYVFFELLAIYKKFQPHIIHTNSSKAGGIAGAAAFVYSMVSKRRMRRVFTVHGWAFLETWRPSGQAFLMRIASKITAFLHHAVIVISKHDEIAAHRYNVARPSKVTRIYNGIADISFLPRLQAQQDLFQAEYPLVIGTIAEYTKNKGIPYLLKAMLIVHKKMPQVVLCLIGWGEEQITLKDMIIKNHMERYVFLISKSPASPFIKAFDIFVLPSLKEGLPYALLEAGLAELPVISTRVGGIPEIIENNLNGILVDPASPHQLADALVKLIDNTQLRKTLGKKNRDRITTLFSLDEMIQQTITVYIKTMNDEIML